MAIRTISPAGGEWSAAATWVEGVAPTIDDDVVANASSGPLAITTTGRVCRSFDLTGMTATWSGIQGLTVGSTSGGPGDAIVTIPASGFTITWTGSFALATSAPNPQILRILRTLASANVTLAGTGTIRLGAALTMGGSRSLSVTAGTLDLGGFDLICNALNCTGNTTRSIIFGTSTVTLSGSSPGLTVTGTNYTISAASATFLLGGFADFDGGNAWYGTVSWAAGSAPRLGSGSTFNNVSISSNSAASLFLPPNGTVTIVNSLTITGIGTVGCINAGPGSSNSTGAEFDSGRPVTITLGAGATTTLSNVNFMDVNFTGVATPVSGTALGDGLGNSGITFNAPRTLYWVGNSGNWMDATKLHWAVTSGGAPGANRPLPQDGVIVDANSFTIPAQTITTDCLWVCRDLSVSTDRTGCKLSTTLASLSIFGNFTLAGTGGFSIAEIVVFRARSTVTLSSQPSLSTTSITVNAFGASLRLANDITLTTLKILKGTVDAAGFAVTVRGFTADMDAGILESSALRELRMGGGTWTLSNANTIGWSNGDVNSSAFTLQPEGSVLWVTGLPNPNPVFADASKQDMPPVVIAMTPPGAIVGSSTGTMNYRDITHLSGGITTTTGSISCTSYTSMGTDVRSLALTSGQFFVFGDILLSGANLTISGSGGGSIFCSPPATKPEATVRTNNTPFLILRLQPPLNGQITVFGALTAATLFTVGPSTGHAIVSFCEPVTVTGTYTATGNNVVRRIKVYGPPWGGRTTITAATTTCTNVDFTNIDQAGTAAWTGTSKIDTSTGYNSQAIGL